MFEQLTEYGPDSPGLLRCPSSAEGRKILVGGSVVGFATGIQPITNLPGHFY